MLSKDNIDRINRQIRDELRTVDSICSDHQEKMEAIERIAQLKALMSTNPPAPLQLPSDRPTLADALIELVQSRRQK